MTTNSNSTKATLVSLCNALVTGITAMPDKTFLLGGQSYTKAQVLAPLQAYVDANAKTTADEATWHQSVQEEHDAEASARAMDRRAEALPARKSRQEQPDAAVAVRARAGEEAGEDRRGQGGGHREEPGDAGAPRDARVEAEEGADRGGDAAGHAGAVVPRTGGAAGGALDDAEVRVLTRTRADAGGGHERPPRPRARRYSSPQVGSVAHTQPVEAHRQLVSHVVKYVQTLPCSGHDVPFLGSDPGQP